MSARYDTTDLSIFFDIGVKKGATHMVVLYQFTGVTNGRNDYNDRHYYVMRGQDPHVEIARHKGELMEVYNLGKDKTLQLLANRAMEV
jgi:hypothetical protein